MNIAVSVEAMLAGGRLKTLVFITFSVSAGNRKERHSVFTLKKNIELVEQTSGKSYPCLLSWYNFLRVHSNRFLYSLWLWATL